MKTQVLETFAANLDAALAKNEKLIARKGETEALLKTRSAIKLAQQLDFVGLSEEAILLDRQKFEDILFAKRIELHIGTLLLTKFEMSRKDADELMNEAGL